MHKINRLMFVSPKIAGGGAERVVSVLSSSLAELGYHVDLILYERKENEYPISSKVVVHMLPARETGQSKIEYLLKKFVYLRRLMKNLKPDVLIPFLPYQVEQSYIASRGLDIPFIVTVRNNPRFDTPNEKMRKHRDLIAKRAEGVFLQTKEQMTYFSDEIQKKCFIVPNPISQDILNTQYHYGSFISKLVTLGRLTEQKNHELLIQAFAKVYKVHPEITLDIYGEGPLKDKLQKLIDNQNLQSAVRLCGRTNDVADTLCQYDLFVMSSDYEGMPNSLMEAMGVGLPCISTDCPTGPKELIGDNERGILIPTNDLEGLAEAIKQMINSAEENSAYGQSAKRFMENKYAPQKIAKQLRDNLANIL